MTRGAPKRRLRIRRKRRDAVVELAEGGEVVAEFGCCLVEAVTSLSVILALLLVPAWFLLR